MSITARFDLTLGNFALHADLELPGRGVCALFGHSGSGKTTLLRCIAGLERVPGGYLEVNGEVWQDTSRALFKPTHQRPLGYVFQEASLFAHLSVRRNLEYGMQRVPHSERRVALEHSIELLGIGQLLERKPAQLSGGERQRVAIARALATSPRLLLMDEPLAALDVQRKREILPYLERLHDELDIPVLYVSHSPEEVAQLADHLVLLELGRVVASGGLGEMLVRLDLPLAHDDEASAVVNAVVAAHDDHYHLTTLEFDGGRLVIARSAQPLGTRVRLRIHARDVSLALARHDDSSILNILPAQVMAIEPARPAQVLVKLCTGSAGRTPLLARITRKSADALSLALGQSLYVQIKSVALMG
ncbi:MAG TPA: molybdenum ABC transporter ATP-binding protein [Gammaproteobacteria bacterium]